MIRKLAALLSSLVLVGSAATASAAMLDVKDGPGTIYSGDAACDAAADQYANRMTHGRPDSPFYSNYHNDYELEYCPVND